MSGPRPTAAWAVLGGWGAALVAVPRWAGRLTGEPQPPSAVVRVLGARRLVQELVLLRWPTREVALAAAAVDGLHAASMLAAVRLWPRYRRAALTSAAISAVSGAVTLVRASR